MMPFPTIPDIPDRPWDDDEDDDEDFKISTILQLAMESGLSIVFIPLKK